MTLLRTLFLFSCCLVGSAFAQPAVGGGFTATLSHDELTATGLDALTATERTALDQLIAKDMIQLRQETSAEPTNSFTNRHTSDERQTTGLDRLTPAQLAKLDTLIAAVAPQPKPKERPRLKESEVIYGPRKLEVHGSASLTYGWGAGGRDFRASSLWLSLEDPAHRFSLGIGISTGQGDFFPGYYSDYGYRSYRAPFPSRWSPFADEFDVWPPYYGLGYRDDYIGHRARLRGNTPGW